MKNPLGLVGWAAVCLIGTLNFVKSLPALSGTTEGYLGAIVGTYVAAFLLVLLIKWVGTMVSKGTKRIRTKLGSLRN